MSQSDRTPYMSTPAITDTLFSFFDNHRDMLQFARKGYVPKLCEMFKSECGYDKNVNWMRKNLYAYRITRDAQLQYCENKYYNSKRKQETQARNTGETKHTEEDIIDKAVAES